MNRCIVDSYNRHIKANDHFYFLGDWSFGKKENVRLFREQLKCENIFIVQGNHDKYVHNYKECFNWIKPKFEGKIGSNFFVLHHYAQRVWIHSHHESYHLFGHSHGSLADDPNSLSFDCGFDTFLFNHEKYTPYSYEEVVNIMRNDKKWVAIDHHKEGVD